MSIDLKPETSPGLRHAFAITLRKLAIRARLDLPYRRNGETHGCDR